MIASTASTRPRFAGSVTSVTHAWNAASFAPGAEERHQAVQRDHRDHGEQDDVRHRREVVHAPTVRKPNAGGADPPEQVAAGDERPAPAGAVGERAQQQGGERRGGGAGGDHRGDHVRVVGDRVVDEQVQVDVLDGPGHLADEAEQHHGDPDPRPQPVGVRGGRAGRAADTRRVRHTADRRRVPTPGDAAGCGCGTGMVASSGVST